MASTKQRTLSEVNKLECGQFVALLGNVVEHTSLCAASVWGCRPFSSVDELQAAFSDFLEQLSVQGKEGLLRLYTELRRLSLNDELTSESEKERVAAGLDHISDDDQKKMAELNGRYKKKFGFHFVVCSRENKVQTVLEGLERRLENSRAEEAVTGVNEVKKICNLRIRDLVVDSSPSKTEGLDQPFSPQVILN